jgi:probable HAF family extracellular repeat protein
MKSRTLTCITAMTLFAALAMPVRLAAQGQKQDLPRYTVTDLGTLGGTFSLAGGLSDSGWVEGYSTLPGDTAVHAFLWRDGVMTDLGTLGGPNSAASWPPSESGEAGVSAEISTPDPNGEDFCGFGTHLICLPSLWQDGVMTPLPTLGGNNGQADEVNNRGQVVGFAETTTPDPTCVAPKSSSLALSCGKTVRSNSSSLPSAATRTQSPMQSTTGAKPPAPRVFAQRLFTPYSGKTARRLTLATLEGR